MQPFISICLAVLAITLTLSHKGVAQEAQIQDLETTIDSFAWIAGHWKGEGMGGVFEETWNPPLGNSMMGMFKLVQEDKVAFYEILTIVKTEDSWLLRLKHFDAGLVGWEEKEKSIEFPLLSVSQTEAVFDGLKFTKVDKDTMHIVVRVQEGDSTEELKFVFQRAGDEVKQ